jgi:hypothetical protein
VQLFGGVMRIVGLVGPKRSGKSTAADVLVRERGFVSIGFADALKDLALRVDPYIGRTEHRLSWWVDQYGWEYAKKRTEVRRFLQALGTDGVRTLNANFWLLAWQNKWTELGCPDVVVPDVRFANEAAWLQDRREVDTLLIRITRPGLDTSDTHVSETEQAGIQCDREIVNGTSVEQLRSDVLFAHDRWLSTS